MGQFGEIGSDKGHLGASSGYLGAVYGKLGGKFGGTHSAEMKEKCAEAGRIGGQLGASFGGRGGRPRSQAESEGSGKKRNEKRAIIRHGFQPSKNEPKAYIIRRSRNCCLMTI